MTLRDFVLPCGGARKDQGMEQARKAADELRAGAAAETIVARYGLTEARRQDQEYYFAVEYRLGDSLFAAVRDLSAGEISAPMAAKDGRMHIVQMVKNDKPVALSFAVARPQVLADFNDAAQTRIMDSTMKFLRSRAKILIGADYAGDYKP